MKKLITLTCLLTFLPAMSSSSAEILYDLIDLDTLGGQSSWPYAINNQGQIVGKADTPTGQSHAVMFDATGSGQNVDLGTLGGNESCAYDINNLGQIVGVAATQQGPTYATLFDPSGNEYNLNLGAIPNGYASIAQSINDNGQIVGTSSFGFRSGATLFDTTGASGNVLLFPDLYQSGARAINNSGQIVGWSQSEYDEYEIATLFDWSSNQAIRLGRSPSSAYAINDSGQIVGMDSELGFVFEVASLFDSTGGRQNIHLNPSLPSAEEQSVANDINDLGQIVGALGEPLGDFRTANAMLFDSSGNGQNLDLNDAIDPSLGWTLHVATAINDDGWIVGYGRDNNKEGHAFLLKPIPEPATLSLLALAALALPRRKPPAHRRLGYSVTHPVPDRPIYHDTHVAQASSLCLFS